MRISDGSSDVCSSDLRQALRTGFDKLRANGLDRLQAALPKSGDPKTRRLSFPRPTDRAASVKTSIDIGTDATGQNVRIDVQELLATRLQIGRATCRERVWQ